MAPCRTEQFLGRLAAGDRWHDTGYVFTAPDGSALHRTRTGPPARSAAWVKDSGLPPVRQHDLRHGAASLAHAAGADLKTVQEHLRHTSIVLTAAKSTSVLLDLHFKVAEATARLVLAAAARNPGRRHLPKISPSKSAAPEPSTTTPVRATSAPTTPATNGLLWARRVPECARRQHHTWLVDGD
jgi:hypothetical protein